MRSTCSRRAEHLPAEPDAHPRPPPRRARPRRRGARRPRRRPPPRRPGPAPRHPPRRRASPLAAFARAHAAGQRAAWWREPAGHRSFAAIETHADPAAPDLAAARARLAAARAALHDDGPDLAPLAVFAAAYDPARPGWPGWPAALLLVPRAVIVDCSTTAERWLALTAPIEPDGDDAADLAALAAARDLLLAPAPEPADGEALTADPAPEESRAAWITRVTALRDACRDSRLAKVVPARAATWTAPPGRRFDLAATLRALAAAEPDAHVFALAHAGAVFLGATPERLCALRGRALDTHALAGTARRDPDPDRDAALGRALADSGKERHEHAVVVDAIASALAPLAEALTPAPAPRLRRLGGLQHLETPIAATLRPHLDLFDAVAALHPTPALGGAPRALARDALAAEPLDRGLYGGPIGHLDARGDGHAAVAIRSALLTPDRARAFAGAGVVAASDPAAEWRETTLKLGTIGRALRLGAIGPAPHRGATP
ncbi:MAG: isochorismate synthase [bacterium]